MGAELLAGAAAAFVLKELPIAVTLSSPPESSNNNVSTLYQRIAGEKPLFDEFIDRFPADFSLNKDSTYSYQPSRRSLSELGGSGLVHTQHSAGAFLLRKPYLKAKTHLKTLLGLNLGELGFVTVLSISSATGGALSPSIKWKSFH